MSARHDKAPSTPSEWQRLIEAAHKGSQEALGQMFEAMRGALLKRARQKLPPALRAKGEPSDLVQETCLDAHLALEQFEGKTKAEFHAWLQRILLNNVADFIDHHQNAQKRRSSKELDLDENQAVVESSLWPSRIARKRERDERLEEALARLPDDYRRVLLLRHQYNKEISEIAWMMDRSEDAARKLWYRALQQLREEIEEG